MRKLIASSAFVLLLAATPVLAQSATVQEQITALLQQIQALQQQLIDLQTQSGGSSTSNGCEYASQISRTLFEGSSGSDVAALQRFLKAQGFFTYPSITTYFGPATESAVKNWQTHHGVVSSGTPETTGYGVVGRLTRAAIGKVCGMPVGSGTSCTAPWGATVAHGFGVAAYESSSVAEGQSCVSQTRVCTDGALSGSYEHASCNPESSSSEPLVSILGPSVVRVGEQGMWRIPSMDGECVSIEWGDESQGASMCNGIASFFHAYTDPGTYTIAAKVDTDEADVMQTIAQITVEVTTSCVFNGQTVEDGSSIKAYQASSVPAGQSCVWQARTCTDGTLSGSYEYSECDPVSAITSCTFDGQTVEDGYEIEAFRLSSITDGTNCHDAGNVEWRSCVNGMLSGSYQYSECADADDNNDSGASCTLDGETVAHGWSIEAFKFSTVVSGCYATGNTETRTCVDGTLSGSFQYSECNETGAETLSSCTFNGETVAHGDSVPAYQYSSVAAGQLCPSQTRTCNDGTLLGSYQYSECSVAEATGNELPAPAGIEAACTGSNDQADITWDPVSGATRYALRIQATGGNAPTISCPSGWYRPSGHTSCAKDDVSGTSYGSIPLVPSWPSYVAWVHAGDEDGNWSPQSTAYFTCANDCTFNGQTVPDGEGVRAYRYSSITSSNPYACGHDGASPNSTFRSCVNGTLHGSAYPYPSCKVIPPSGASASCAFGGLAVAHGDSIEAFQSSSVPAGQSCVSQMRTCTDGTLSGSYQYGSCDPVEETTGETTEASNGLSSACSSDGTSVTLSWNSVASAQAYALRVDDPSTNTTSSCGNSTVSGPNRSCVTPTDYVDDSATSGITLTISPNTDYNWWLHASVNGQWGSPIVSSFRCASSGSGAYGGGASNTANALSALEAALKGLQSFLSGR